MIRRTIPISNCGLCSGSGFGFGIVWAIAALILVLLFLFWFWHFICIWLCIRHNTGPVSGTPFLPLGVLFLWLYLELALDLYLNVLSSARVSVYLHFQLCCAGQHCHKGTLTGCPLLPFSPSPLSSPFLIPFTHQVWLWLRLELFCVRHFNESI